MFMVYVDFVKARASLSWGRGAGRGVRVKI